MAALGPRWPNSKRNQQEEEKRRAQQRREEQKQKQKQQQQNDRKEKERQDQQRKKEERQNGLKYHGLGVGQWNEGYKLMNSEKQEALNRFLEAQVMYSKAVELNAGELSQTYLNGNDGIKKWINLMVEEKAKYQKELSNALSDLYDPNKSKYGAQKRDNLLKVVVGLEKEQQFQGKHFSKQTNLDQLKQQANQLNQQQKSLKEKFSQAKKEALSAQTKCKNEQLKAFQSFLDAQINLQQFSGGQLSQEAKVLAQKVNQLKADKIEAVNAHSNGVKYWTQGYNSSKLKDKLDFYYKVRDQYVISNAFDPLLSGDGDYLNGEGGIKKWIREAEKQKAQLLSDLSKAFDKVNGETKNINLRQRLRNRENLIVQLKRVNKEGFGYDAELSKQKQVVSQIKKIIASATVKFQQGVSLWNEAQYSKTAIEKLQKYFQVCQKYRQLAQIDGKDSHADTYLRHMRQRHIPETKMDVEIEFTEKKMEEMNAHINKIQDLEIQNQKIYD